MRLSSSARRFGLGLLTSAAVLAQPVMVQAADATEPAFRALYKELVETNTTLSSGSCTLAAERMAARLKAAGFADADLWVFSTPEHPKDGGLVATFKGTDAKLKPIMLLAHVDVVEAKCEDWVRDPFTLIEEDGYFYGRGTVDDKAMAAIFTDSLIRYKAEGFKPKRGLKLVLTCGEETSGAFNGAQWLTQNKRELIDAEFGLNEGASSRLDDKGNKIFLAVQAGEKVYQDFTLETTSPGGHSSQPTPEDPMVDMSKAIINLKAYTFPVHLIDATRGYFTRMAALKTKAGDAKTGEMMARIAKDPTDKEADAYLSKDKAWNATLRTACVTTLINGGHAPNALPQRVKANVNCRIIPGESVESVRDALSAAINDPKVSLAIHEPRSLATPSAKLTDRILKPIEALAAKQYPGIPVVPIMSTGATDSIYTNAVGIPTYGISGLFTDADGNGVHGLNERVSVRALMDSRAFLHSLIKVYAGQ